MKNRFSQAKAFLIDEGIDPSVYSMEQGCESFISEMERGLSGKSSLHMLPTYISMKNKVPVGEPVVVLDAGGTNFRTCTVEFDENLESKITNFHKNRMPGFEREVSADEFFNRMAALVEPVIETGKKIGFCFSYPAEITPNRDGRLIYFSKEIKAPEVKGKLIGQGLLDALGREKTAHIESLTILNDTVATLLAAKSVPSDIPYSGYIGFILGTGTNTCYLEKNGNIPKAAGVDPAGSQIINVESGSYDFPATSLDTDFYRTTQNPEGYKFEKLISGAYLGPYCGSLIARALKEGLLSEEFGSRFSKVDSINTIIMDDFLHFPYDKNRTLASCCNDREDEQVLYHLLDTVIKRAGKLSAMNLSAAVLKENIGVSPSAPACINADGTTFYKTHNLKFYTERYVSEFLGEVHNRHYDIISVDNAPVLGAAMAGLMN